MFERQRGKVVQQVNLIASVVMLGVGMVLGVLFAMIAGRTV